MTTEPIKTFAFNYDLVGQSAPVALLQQTWIARERQSGAVWETFLSAEDHFATHPRLLAHR